MIEITKEDIRNTKEFNDLIYEITLMDYKVYIEDWEEDNDEYLIYIPKLDNYSNLSISILDSDKECRLIYRLTYYENRLSEWTEATLSKDEVLKELVKYIQ